MMDIAADLLFSDHGAPEYTAGRAGSMVNSYDSAEKPPILEISG